MSGAAAGGLCAVLVEARALIAAGWYRGIGAHNEHETDFSVTGAIGRAIKQLRCGEPLAMIEAACSAVMSVVGESMPHGDYLRLAVWSSASARTHQEVLDAFDLAIERSR